ncbi:succinyldiaminopimelate transaminase [Corynebacterium sp. 13CS0277]|uniref:succinyldiaminopimelate transaminase n=1 Tax=Corynebacterium sp. 13CS0277 TaxID=2071994 RepID=UPI000D03F6D4|nr:succinyldiaminopimelate transaminase [Corynebacterium sp. 13CS0277]PRQ12355.1 succinyldiaminopimelate transaminase [Corynebacterium sp. 13CS0277]
MGERLPDFPWDSLAEATATAAAHPDGIVNLSVGTPVDEVAPSIQLALSEAAAAPGYPQTIGTPALREAIVAACARRYNMTGLTVDSILPVIGTKEAIAWLPTLLGAGPGHTVVIPEVAYPTYEVAALVAGATPQRADSLTQLGPASPTLMFINSPSNPTGKVLGKEHLRKVVDFARQRGTIILSDECYLGLNWAEEKAYSILAPEVCDGDHTGLIAIHSLSKTSNLASYRSGFLAGDQALIRELLEVRKHTGLMMPGPIQAATVAALEDDMQEDMQRLRYARRREVLLRAVVEAGFQVDYSDAGLYLWATRGENCRDTVAWFAERGILVAPGDFYGPKGTQHVRIALTASDERIAAAAERLTR